MSKPVKYPRKGSQTQVPRTTSVGIISPPPGVVESAHRMGTGSPEEEGETITIRKAPRHPKGHKTKDVTEIWKMMDDQKFLRLTDTPSLIDVWVQPKEVKVSKSTDYVDVTFRQVILGYHVKSREAKCAMSCDDLLKMFYLTDMFACDANKQPRLEFEDWLNEQTAKYVKAEGEDAPNDHAHLCKYILEDSDFDFYPFGEVMPFTILFRKICCHSYFYPPKGHKEPVYLKVNNGCLIKCAANETFEYALEARIFPLPDEWREIDKKEVWQEKFFSPPETQPY